MALDPTLTASDGALDHWNRFSDRRNCEGFMQSKQRTILICGAMLLFSSAAFAQTGSCSDMSLGPNANLNGFRPFPDDNAWNTNISSLPADPNSDNFIAFIGSTSPLHPDFGAGLYLGRTIGIPYQVEAATQPKVAVRIVAYKSESDPGADAYPGWRVDRGLSQARQR